MLVQQGPGRGQEARRDHRDTLALHGLDDEPGDVAAAQLGFEGVEVAERDHRVRQQRAETLAELR